MSSKGTWGNLSPGDNIKNHHHKAYDKKFCRTYRRIDLLKEEFHGFGNKVQWEVTSTKQKQAMKRKQATVGNERNTVTFHVKAGNSRLDRARGCIRYFNLRSISRTVVKYFHTGR